MWILIKTFAGKFLKTRVGGIISNFFGGWQLYLILGALLGGYILSLKVNSWILKKKLKTQVELVVEYKEKYNSKKTDLKICKKVNTGVINDILAITTVANQCKALFEELSELKVAQIKELTEKSNEYKKQIQKIKDLKPKTACDLEPLDLVDANWLLGKADNKN